MAQIGRVEKNDGDAALAGSAFGLTTVQAKNRSLILDKHILECRFTGMELKRFILASYVGRRGNNV